eukprot:3625651-Rhodomonas_salina.3
MSFFLRRLTRQTLGSASPAALTTAVKAKRVGSGEKKHIRKALEALAQIGTPETHTAMECPELKAQAEARATTDKQVESRVETLRSRAGMPENWEWDYLILSDCLC